MVIVVLGQYHRERSKQPFQPGWGLPAQLAGMPPPDVQLAECQTGYSAGP